MTAYTRFCSRILCDKESSGETNSGKEGFAELVVASGNSTEIFYLVEEALYSISFRIFEEVFDDRKGMFDPRPDLRFNLFQLPNEFFEFVLRHCPDRSTLGRDMPVRLFRTGRNLGAFFYSKLPCVGKHIFLLSVEQHMGQADVGDIGRRSNRWI